MLSYPPPCIQTTTGIFDPGFTDPDTNTLYNVIRNRFSDHEAVYYKKKVHTSDTDNLHFAMVSLFYRVLYTGCSGEYRTS